MFKFLFLIFCSVYVTHSAVAPFIKKCESDDSKCLKESAQATIPIFVEGIENLGVEKLDPFNIKYLDASSQLLKLILKDATVRGLRNTVVKKIRRNKLKSKLSITLLCSVDLEGEYELDGQVLILPIRGKGRLHAALRKVQISVEADLGVETGADGVQHWTVKDWNHNYQLKDKSTLELDNLFDGNDVLAQAAKQLIATSGNEIILEVGSPIVNAIATKIVENVKNFFKNVPATELEN
ncbi:circadian clock-controlled protein-like [Bombyx mandarina]|uniref:Circadian clock-controlled protein-like n=1 Tax=Bombyx mandarina TaxID=7092 RepID=A0A6J2K2K3_BOMMA|nr:circadian clock-controlled protein-like [Bombyx mandarina]